MASCTPWAARAGTRRRWARRRLPTPRGGQAVVAAGNGQIYALGGVDDRGRTVATVEAYDPATDRWVSRAAMPTARSGLGAAFLGGRIYAIGGLSAGGHAL